MREQRSHAISGVFVFLLLGVFAVFSTVLVLFGAQAYRSTAGKSADHNEQRVLYAYLVNAVSADDASGVIGVSEIDGIDVLTVNYDYGSERYIKYVYCYGGSLRELFVSEAYGFSPDGGSVICPARDLQASVANGLIDVLITDSMGRPCAVQLALRSDPA